MEVETDGDDLSTECKTVECNANSRVHGTTEQDHDEENGRPNQPVGRLIKAPHISRGSFNSRQGNQVF